MNSREFADLVEQVIAQIGRSNVRILATRLELHKNQNLSYESILIDELKVSTMGENYPPV